MSLWIISISASSSLLWNTLPKSKEVQVYICFPEVIINSASFSLKSVPVWTINYIVTVLTVKVKVKSLSCVQLFATPWTVAHQALPSVGFSRQEYWSGLPFPSPGDLPYPGIEPGSPALQADTLTAELPEEYILLYTVILWLCQDIQHIGHSATFLWD